VIPGGGGIHPDVVAGSDSLTQAEREFAKALGSKIPAYRDVLTTYAIELKVQGAVKEEAYTPTPVQRAELLRRIRAKGADLPDSVWAGVRQFIDQQLSYEAVHYSFNRAAEFKRRAADDVQVQKAIQLLQRARTPRDLIALASANTAPGAATGDRDGGRGHRARARRAGPGAGPRARRVPRGRSRPDPKPLPPSIEGTFGTTPPWLPRVAIVLIAVPDDAIGPVAADLARTRSIESRHTVLHLSGVRNRSALAVLEKTGAALGSLHPCKRWRTPNRRRSGCAALWPWPRVTSGP